MKQIVQNYRKGSISIEEFPIPSCKSGGVLVRTLYSAVSVGTEKMKLKNAGMNYLQMAKAKPQQVKQVLTTMKQLGPLATYRKVMNKLDTMTPLGYSCVGEVIEVGSSVNDIKIGDRVACAGGGYAVHAEVNFVPKNLIARIPEGVVLEEAAFTTIAAIALQGFRQADAKIGEHVGVLGLGLLGQILVQIVRASGCRAIGFDLDEKKNKLALRNGAVWTGQPEMGIAENIVQIAGGYGVDKIILAVGTDSNSPVDFAAAIARDRARVVDIGITRMDIPWEPYYMKEMDIRLSRSYGPGRYDPLYEEGGIDYPVGYVRWTEQRNMEAILNLLKDKKLNFQDLITHRFDFDDAISAYEKIEEGKENILGVIFKYAHQNGDLLNTVVNLAKRSNEGQKINLGIIGAGNFAKTMLLPFLKNEKVNCHTVATATGISAKDTALKFGFGSATTDYKEILGDSNINTVMVLTRHASHGKFVKDVLSAGKNVYVEKPLCVDIAELEDIESAIRSSGTLLMVGYNRRFSPSIIKLRELIDGLGVPVMIHYRVNAGFIPPDHWYQETKHGGRIIGEGCHFVDTLQFLTNSLPVSVSATSLNSDDKSMPNHDSIVATVQFRSGAVGILEYVSDGDNNFPKEQIMVTGGRSNIFFDNFKEIVVFKGGKKKKFGGYTGKGHKQEMKILVQAFEKGEMPISWESLKLTSLATQAIMDAQREGRAVFL